MPSGTLSPISVRVGEVGTIATGRLLFEGRLIEGAPPPPAGGSRGVPAGSTEGPSYFVRDFFGNGYNCPRGACGIYRGVACGGGGGVGGGGGGGVRIAMSSRSSSFPIRNDAGYIGYLTDDDERVGSGGGGSGSGDDIISVVHRRRRELLGPDISFTMCCLLMVMVMMVMVMVWGFRPPTAGNFVGGCAPQRR